MWLGRRLRTATESQRVALIARDQCCIGCKANPLWCKAHHIVWWSNDGTTDFDNLVLVCDDCHHKIHDHGWQVHRDPETGRYELKPPTNRTRRKRPGEGRSAQLNASEAAGRTRASRGGKTTAAKRKRDFRSGPEPPPPEPIPTLDDG